MAREAVGAMDFLGLGKSLCERDIDFNMERERGKLVKPMASLPFPSFKNSGTNAGGEGERDSSVSRLAFRSQNTLSMGPRAPSLSQGMSWPSLVGKDEDMGGVGVNSRTRSEKSPKPLEELTDADIMLMTKEDCKDYLKRRVMHRNSWNKTQTIQPVMTLRGHFDARQEEEKPAIKSGGSPPKNGVGETPSLGPSSPPSWQQDTAGPSHSGPLNGFPVPRFNVTTQQASPNEEGHGGARPSDRGTPAPDSSLSLSIPSTREQPPSTQPSGFGSPLPSPFLRMLKPADSPLAAIHGQRPPHGQPGQGGSTLVGSMARSAGQSHLPGRPPTAQLTIFYSGMVNVYDEVPADKAQAIMLLAGSGSTWSSSFMSPPASVAARPPSNVGVASSSNASASTAAAPSSAAPPSSTPTPALTIGIAGAAAPLVPAMLVAGALKPAPGTPGRTTLHAELPHARKASLARFLEKRKDRARGKGPYVTPTVTTKKPIGDGSSTPPREKSPSPCNSKIRTRSPSPVSTGPSRKRSASPAPRPGPSQSSGSEASSPSQRPGTPQQSSQPSMPEESVFRRSNKEEQLERGSQQQPQSSKDEKPEPMNEDTGSPLQRH